ncbi:hypothetical protein NX794_10205 [Streptomyces sp. LP11]|uniref:Transposase n=1 Tax=Streptomyces pyxinicus TaxID=2970331 RepID=A0ABT2AZ93_9ACTN|nr:hypothetical protein [Streptomyces sp. LP11]MCS0601587.1 hypothetical protein [Streptomyces sp. LP11]
MIVLAVLRHDQRLADMAVGNNVSESTVRHRRDEAIALLAAQAPRLDRALKKIAGQGGEVVLIDGTLVHTQRRTGKADRKNCSGKQRLTACASSPSPTRGAAWCGSPPPGPAAHTTTLPPATITSCSICAPPASAPSRNSAFAAWTTTYSTP